jgi:serralysin
MQFDLGIFPKLLNNESDFSRDLNGSEYENYPLDTIEKLSLENREYSPARAVNLATNSPELAAFAPQTEPSAKENTGNLLNQSFGWLGNSNNVNQLPAFRSCGCSSCCGQVALSTTATLSNLSTTSTTTVVPIQGLLSGYQWNLPAENRQITYSFFSGGSYYSNTTMTPVSEGTRNNVRGIFARLQELINVNFVEVPDVNGNPGQIRFLLNPSVPYAAAAYPISSTIDSIDGDVFLNPSFDHATNTNGFQNPAGRHGYMTLIHEIGHALGLKHPHEGTPILAPELDNTTNTVMTYNFNGNSAGTFMPFDIQALQYLYGAKNSRTGNETYLFTGRIDQFNINGQAFLPTSFLTKLTIWDAGGVDTLDFSQLNTNSTGYRLDINPGGILTTQSAYNATQYAVNSVTYFTTSLGTAIAYDVLIENVVNSSSSDTIFLNAAANTVRGYRSNGANGNDTIWNATNQDTLDFSQFSPSSVTQSQNGQDLVLGLGSQGSVTIKNHFALTTAERINILYGAAPVILPTISIADFTINEGSGTATVTASLSAVSSQIVNVNYSTANNTALAGQHYTPTSGTLTFNPGVTTASFTVGIINNTIINTTAPNFFVNLTNPQNATINDGQAIGTIIDNDQVPTLSIANVSFGEGTSKRANSTRNFAVTVNLLNGGNQTVSVNYVTANGTASAGSDYVAINNATLSFAPGETSKTFNIAVFTDAIGELNETVLVNFSNSVGANISNSQASVTILNDDGAVVQSRISRSLPQQDTLSAPDPRQKEIAAKSSEILSSSFRGSGDRFSANIDPFSQSHPMESLTFVPPQSTLLGI